MQQLFKTSLHSLEQNKNGALQLSPSGLNFHQLFPKKIFILKCIQKKIGSMLKKQVIKIISLLLVADIARLAFSKLMRSMDFYIRLYDERKNLKTMLENNVVHEKHFVDDYAAIK